MARAYPPIPAESAGEPILWASACGGRTELRPRRRRDDADLDRLDQVGADKASEQSGKAEQKNLSTTAMRWLSVAQRAQYIRNLTGGILGSDEERRIYELYITAATTADRHAVYKLVEGHAWSGKLHQGDSLWLVFQDTKWRGPFTSLMNFK